VVPLCDEYMSSVMLNIAGFSACCDRLCLLCKNANKLIDNTIGGYAALAMVICLLLK